MKFTEKNLQHIAELARLNLSKEELFLYGKQLSDITTYIEVLQTISLGAYNKVEIDLKNAWREDKAEPWDLDESESALGQAEREAGLIKVKRVL
jgi:aspartyl-tRNA(Asn)/glutamyl-tRNA(Gln) amidotransferase subunit C